MATELEEIQKAYDDLVKTGALKADPKIARAARDLVRTGVVKSRTADDSPENPDAYNRVTPNHALEFKNGKPVIKTREDYIEWYIKRNPNSAPARKLGELTGGDFRASSAGTTYSKPVPRAQWGKFLKGYSDLGRNALVSLAEEIMAAEAEPISVGTVPTTKGLASRGKLRSTVHKRETDAFNRTLSKAAGPGVASSLITGAVTKGIKSGAGRVIAGIPIAAITAMGLDAAQESVIAKHLGERRYRERLAQLEKDMQEFPGMVGAANALANVGTQNPFKGGLGTRMIGGTIPTALEAGNQLRTTGEIDPLQLAYTFGLGALTGGQDNAIQRGTESIPGRVRAGVQAKRVAAQNQKFNAVVPEQVLRALPAPREGVVRTPEGFQATGPVSPMPAKPPIPLANPPVLARDWDVMQMAYDAGLEPPAPKALPAPQPGTHTDATGQYFAGGPTGTEPSLPLEEMLSGRFGRLEFEEAEPLNLLDINNLPQYSTQRLPTGGIAIDPVSQMFNVGYGIPEGYMPEIEPLMNSPQGLRTVLQLPETTAADQRLLDMVSRPESSDIPLTNVDPITGKKPIVIKPPKGSPITEKGDPFATPAPIGAKPTVMSAAEPKPTRAEKSAANKAAYAEAQAQAAAAMQKAAASKPKAAESQKVQRVTKAEAQAEAQTAPKEVAVPKEEPLPTEVPAIPDTENKVRDPKSPLKKGDILYWSGNEIQVKSAGKDGDITFVPTANPDAKPIPMSGAKVAQERIGKRLGFEKAEPSTPSKKKSEPEAKPEEEAPKKMVMREVGGKPYDMTEEDALELDRLRAVRDKDAKDNPTDPKYRTEVSKQIAAITKKYIPGATTTETPAQNTNTITEALATKVGRKFVKDIEFNHADPYFISKHGELIPTGNGEHHAQAAHQAAKSAGLSTWGNADRLPYEQYGIDSAPMRAMYGEGNLRIVTQRQYALGGKYDPGGDHLALTAPSTGISNAQWASLDEFGKYHNVKNDNLWWDVVDPSKGKVASGRGIKDLRKFYAEQDRIVPTPEDAPIGAKPEPKKKLTDEEKSGKIDKFFAQDEEGTRKGELTKSLEGKTDEEVDAILGKAERDIDAEIEKSNAEIKAQMTKTAASAKKAGKARGKGASESGTVDPQLMGMIAKNVGLRIQRGLIKTYDDFTKHMATVGKFGKEVLDELWAAVTFRDRDNNIAVKPSALTGSPITTPVPTELTPGQKLRNERIAARNPAPIGAKPAAAPGQKMTPAAAKLMSLTPKMKRVQTQNRKAQKPQRAERIAKMWATFDSAGGGVKGIHAGLSKMTGELDRPFKMEIPPEFTDKDLDDLINDVRNAPDIVVDGYEKLSAVQSLTRMLVDRTDTPTHYPRKQLEKIFGKDFADALKDIHEANLEPKTKLEWLKVFRDLQRGNVYSGDIAGVALKQSILHTGNHPFEAGRFLTKAWRAAVNPDFYEAELGKIHKSDNKSLWQESLLKMPGLENEQQSRLGLSANEELFTNEFIHKLAKERLGDDGSIARKALRVAAKINGGWERLHQLYLAQVRAAEFDRMVSLLKKGGVEPSIDDYRAAAGFVNVATGSGGLGAATDKTNVFGTKGSWVQLEKHSDLMNTIFGAPRYRSSRLALASGPVYFGRLWRDNPKVALQYLRQSSVLAGEAMATLGMLSLVPGVEIYTDPRHEEFGRIKVGDRRIEIGGLTPYLRMYAQLLVGQEKDMGEPVRKIYTPTGELLRAATNQRIGGGAAEKDNMFAMLGRKTRQGFSPFFDGIARALSGKDAIGRDVDMVDNLTSQLLGIPLSSGAKDWREDSMKTGLMTLFLEVLGVQTASYNKEKEKAKKEMTASLKK